MPDRPGMPPSPGTRPSRSGSVPGWRGAILAVTVAALLAGFGLIVKARQPADAGVRAGGSATGRVEPGMRSTPGPSGRAAVAIPSDTRTTFIATASIPSGASSCGAGGMPRAAAGNGRTSCGLALAVRDAWKAGAARIGSAVTLQVTDPLNGESLAIRCLGRPPIVCVGSADRLVYLY